MLFLLATADASTPIDAIAHMTLAQLKALLAAARVVGPGGVAADGVDRAFSAVLATPRALARCGGFLFRCRARWVFLRSRCSSHLPSTLARRA
jgi:hypothetical protein